MCHGISYHLYYTIAHMSHCEIINKEPDIVFERRQNYAHLYDLTQLVAQDTAIQIGQEWINRDCLVCDYYRNDCIPSSVSRRSRGRLERSPAISARNHPDLQTP